ncbi:hypothetical protein Tsp_01724 [Trichinella spiralis]|uniref:hypothetical protein n=1 Tax=Trichinella spiralis TaxID=6334 RepID=UPI0001EFCA6D|nr:hypothetical protein Tsp_01724 [Trichinella spiralis]
MCIMKYYVVRKIMLFIWYGADADPCGKLDRLIFFSYGIRLKCRKPYKAKMQAICGDAGEVGQWGFNFFTSEQTFRIYKLSVKIRAAAGSTARLPCHAYTIITADLDNNDSAITDVQWYRLTSNEIYFCNKLSRFDENACGYGYCELEINSIDNQPLVKCICEYGYSGLFCESKDDEYQYFAHFIPCQLNKNIAMNIV